MKLFSKTTGGFYDPEIHGNQIPADAADITEERYAALMSAQASGKRIEADANGAPVAVDPPAPTSEQIIAALSAQIQLRLDSFAGTRNYDGILSACTYATSSVPKFSAEGQACVNLRDATWSAAYDILAQVQAGTRPRPSSIADIEADLPALVWPA